MTAISIYACGQVETNFNVEVFIPPGSQIDHYFQLALKYGWTSFPASVYTDNPDIDYASKEAQLTLLDFYDKL